MEKSATIQQIEAHLTKGETDKAIKLLLEYTTHAKVDAHDEAILLSGQFKQWKRDQMLGVEQSRSELRRIEATILDIVYDRVDTNQQAYPTSSPTPPAPRNSQQPIMYLVGAGILALVLFGLWFAFNAGTHTNDQSALNTASVVSGGNDDGVPAGFVPPEKENADPVTSGFRSPEDPGTPRPPVHQKNKLSAGEVLAKNEQIVSKNGQYLLRISQDGQLQLVSAADEYVEWTTDIKPKPEEPTATDFELRMQDDGNLVFYQKTDRWHARWASQTSYSLRAGTLYHWENGKEVALETDDAMAKMRDLRPVEAQISNAGVVQLVSQSGNKKTVIE